MDIYKLKCIVVGECNVGKTCLIRKIVYNNFTTGYRNTIGVDFATKEKIQDDKMFVYHFWDISGKEKYSNIVPVFFRNSSMAWVCFDLSDPETLRQTVFWKREIERHLSIPIILVGCKSDLTKFDESELEKFSRKHSFSSLVITSSKKTSNINELLEVSCSIVKDYHKPVEKYDIVPLIPPVEPEKPVEKKCCV